MVIRSQYVVFGIDLFNTLKSNIHTLASMGGFLFTLELRSPGGGRDYQNQGERAPFQCLGLCEKHYPSRQTLRT